jgi:hypothetical protein
MNANATTMQMMRTIQRPVRLCGLLPVVARQICCDMAAGLKGSASNPLPGSGHITGGVGSLSGVAGTAGRRRRLPERSITETLGRPMLAVTTCPVKITKQRDLRGVMYNFIHNVQGKVGVARFAVQAPV